VGGVLTGFNTRANRHTGQTAGFGGLDEFLAVEACVFHGDTSPIDGYTVMKGISGTDKWGLRLTMLAGQLLSAIPTNATDSTEPDLAQHGVTILA